MHADKKATTGKIADVPVPKTDERTVCRQECGPSCTLRIRGDQRCMRESTETTHGVCNFPLAAAERCERVNVDVYAPRNMRNVIDSMAETRALRCGPSLGRSAATVGKGLHCRSRSDREVNMISHMLRDVTHTF